jgi:microcystin-dependent protein
VSEPFLAEVRMFGMNFPPSGWSFCDGQLLPINQHQSLYSLLGTNYGGDGRTTFGLPDLRGRTPVHPGGSIALGNKGGADTIRLSESQIPAHSHQIPVNRNQATDTNPDGNRLATKKRRAYSRYAAASSDPAVAMRGGTIEEVGGAAHENMQPFLALNYCIALQGLFPSRN